MANHPMFSPHGQYEAFIDDRVLVTRANGSWNIEMHRKMSEASAPLVAKLEASGPWASLVEVTETLVTSFAVLEAGRKAVEESDSIRNLVALAWVIRPDVEGYDLLLPTYRRMYQGLLASEVFESIDQARAWLDLKLSETAGRAS